MPCDFFKKNLQLSDSFAQEKIFEDRVEQLVILPKHV